MGYKIHKVNNDVGRLAEFLPLEALEPMTLFLDKYNVVLKIVGNRVTKLGTFKKPDIITVNGSLNKYHFLLTLLHECAHLIVCNSYRLCCKPHGKEWKFVFSNFISDYLKLGCFDQELVPVLKKFAENPLGSFNAVSPMGKKLLAFDKAVNETISLIDLPMGSFFKLSNGMIMRKDYKHPRFYSKYVCFCKSNGKNYLVHRYTSIYCLMTESI